MKMKTKSRVISRHWGAEEQMGEGADAVEVSAPGDELNYRIEAAEGFWAKPDDIGEFLLISLASGGKCV